MASDRAEPRIVTAARQRPAALAVIRGEIFSLFETFSSCAKCFVTGSEHENDNRRNATGIAVAMDRLACSITLNTHRADGEPRP